MRNTLWILFACVFSTLLLVTAPVQETPHSFRLSPRSGNVTVPAKPGGFSGGTITGVTTVAPSVTNANSFVVDAPNGITAHPFEVQIAGATVGYFDAAGTFHAAAGITINNSSGIFLTGPLTVLYKHGANNCTGRSWKWFQLLRG